MLIDSLSKVDILNSQFKYVFTSNTENKFSQLSGTHLPNIKPLHIYENCVFMILDRIDVIKSTRPDRHPERLLQGLAKEITPVLHYIFFLSQFTRVNYLWNGYKIILH